MTPSPLAPTADEAEIFAVARDIQNWQRGCSMSDVKLMKLYPALGSAKTFRKLCNEDSASLIVEDWLPKYRSVKKLIDDGLDQRAEQTIYDDLGTSSSLIEMGAKLLNHRGLNRILFVEGDSGSGKTFALSALARRHPGMVVKLEGSVAWSSPCAFLMSSLSAVTGADVDTLPNHFLKLQSRLTAELQQRRVLLMIDESQHLSGPGLNVLKWLVNNTPGAFVIAGQSTLWRRIQAAFWPEAKQLRHNRCFGYLTFGAPDLTDIKLFVTRRAKIEKLNASTWNALADMAAKHGGFAFLRDAVDAASLLLPTDEPIDEVTLLAAADSIRIRAGGKR